MRMTLHILTFQLADMCNRCECIECDRVNVERKTAHKIAPSCHFYPHWIYINTIIIRCINALFGAISTLDMYMDFPSQYQSERHFRREETEMDAVVRFFISHSNFIWTTSFFLSRCSFKVFAVMYFPFLFLLKAEKHCTRCDVYTNLPYSHIFFLIWLTANKLNARLFAF